MPRARMIADASAGAGHAAPLALPLRAIGIGEIMELIRDDLEGVERSLETATAGPRALSAIAADLHAAGGKRLRPALHLLVARACGYHGPAAVRLGTVIELIHAATLVHDDVIDEAETRRGRAAAHRLWGQAQAVRAGDWLFLDAFQRAVAERDLRLLELLSAVMREMVEGELLQLRLLRRLQVTEGEALEICRRKTACLFALSARLGALLAGASGAEEELLWRFGLDLGLAFQLVDDLLDFTADARRLGKPVLGDLRQGKVTLPLIYALARGGRLARVKVAAVLSDRGFAAVAPEEVIALVRESGAAALVQQRAGELLRDAALCLDPLPDSPYKTALGSVLGAVGGREY